MNIIKNKLIKKLYYKRNTDIDLIMSRNIKDTLKEGDTIRFFGSLYSNTKYTSIVASTVIDYKIVLVTNKGILIETTNKYIFNDKSTLKLKGKIFSPNFSVTNNKVNPYKTDPAYILVTKGTQKYDHSFGHAMYVINGNGTGIIKLNVDMIEMK
jgi:hypothetical protein